MSNNGIKAVNGLRERSCLVRLEGFRIYHPISGLHAQRILCFYFSEDGIIV